MSVWRRTVGILMIEAPERVVALGDPSYVWRSGQDRRLAFIRRYAPLEKRRILDVGCGIGTYVSKLREFSNQVYGIDIEEGRLRRGAQSLPGLALAASEHLPFRDGAFDLVLLHLARGLPGDHRRRSHRYLHAKPPLSL
jgi:SAM-dependent methyltransferase